MFGENKFSRRKCTPGDTVYVKGSGLWMVLSVAMGCGASMCKCTTHGEDCGLTSIVFIAPRAPVNAEDPHRGLNPPTRTLCAKDNLPFNGIYTRFK